MSVRAKLGGAVAVLAALTLVAAGISSRVTSEQRLASWTADRAVPRVSTIRPAAAAASADLTLPASLQAMNMTPVYARTTGYVNRWLVDIGDEVRKGQLLAVLDAPELEQQLAEARAALQTALANQALAESSSARWNRMLAKEAVSKQEADEKAGDLAAKSAVSSAARANVARLEFLMGFTRLFAPFDGIVTGRSAQVGTLVTAGTASATPLFTIADVSRIRAFVRMPQVYSADLRPGMEVRLSLPEYAGRTFVATLTRTSGAIDPSSGSLLVELQASNDDRALKPGAYAQALFALRNAAHSVTLPPSAIILGERGPQVALLTSDGKAQLRTVSLGRDLGTSVEILSGLAPADAVIDNPPDALETGDRVETASAATEKTGGGR